MNKPTPVQPIDADLGLLDENGQQIWSPEEEAAFERLRADPAYWEGIRMAEEDFAAGRFYTHEEVVAKSAARRAHALAERRR